WTREYGKGRVFYTSLGHREDVWDPTWADPNGKRENPPEVAETYQKHLLGGIRWALGITGAAGTPRAEATRGRGRSRGDNPLGFDAAGTAAALMVTQGDKDGNGALARAELSALADAWFEKLDPDGSGKLSPDRFASKFGDLLPREEQGFGPGLILAPSL